MILTNQRDVFRYDAGAEKVEYMTPIYATGSAEVITGGTTTTVTGTATAWDTNITTTPDSDGYGKNAKAGYEISFGAADETDPGATWYEIDSVTGDLELELTSAIAAVADGDYTIRQLMRGDNNDIWESETFRDAQGGPYAAGLDVYFLTNGVEMMSWDGSSEQMDWFYPGFVAKNLRTHKQTLAMWNFTEGGVNKPGALRYTELNYPFNWTTNGAGEVLPADGVLDLLNVVPLGDQIVCYYQGDIVLMQYVGPPFYFIARVAVPGKGLIAQRAVMDFGDYHELLSRDSIYRFDGVQLLESAKQVFREVLRRASPNLIGQAYAYMDEENGEVIWSVPLGSDGQDADQAPTTAYVEHYLEDVGPSLPTPCTIRDFPFTAVGQYISSSSLTFDDFPATAFEDSALQFDDRALQSAFPFLVVGDNDGNVAILNTTNTKFGAGYLSYARFPRTALGDGEFKGLVHRIEPHATRRQGATSYPLRVMLATSDFADGDIGGWYGHEFDLTQRGSRYVSVRQAGRYGEVIFFTTGADGPAEPWDCAGYEIKVSAMGDR
jgi:hypothetical protein